MLDRGVAQLTWGDGATLGVEESFRALRTNIECLTDVAGTVLQVTSPDAGSRAARTRLGRLVAAPAPWGTRWLASVWWGVALPEPKLSVVCSTGEPTVARTLESIHASAEAAGLAAEIVLVGQGEAAPPSLGDEVRHLTSPPVGLSYARNPGMQPSAAPLVPFVAADEVPPTRWSTRTGLLPSSRPSLTHRSRRRSGPVAPLDDDVPACPDTHEGSTVGGICAADELTMAECLCNARTFSYRPTV